MKSLDLKNYGIQEMNAVEMREVDGGGVITWLVVGALTYVFWDIAMNPKSACKAVEDGYNEEKAKNQ